MLRTFAEHVGEIAPEKARPVTDEARRAVQSKLTELRESLRKATERRDELEGTIKHHEAQVTEARSLHYNACAEEGALRMQIGELEKALDAL